MVRTVFDYLLAFIVIFSVSVYAATMQNRIGFYQQEKTIILVLESAFVFTLVGCLILQIRFWRRKKTAFEVDHLVLWLGTVLGFVLFQQRALQWDALSPHLSELQQFLKSLSHWPTLSSYQSSIPPLQTLFTFYSHMTFIEELRLRFGAVLFSTLASLGMFFVLVQLVKRPLIAFILALFFNFSPMVARYSMEGNWISLALFTFVLLIYFLIEMISNHEKSPWQLLVASAVFALSLPSSGGLFLLGLLLWISFFIPRSNVAAIGTGFLAFLPTASAPSFKFWPTIAAFNQTLSPVRSALLVLGGAILLWFLISLRRTTGRIEFFLIGLWILVIALFPAHSPAYLTLSLVPLFLASGRAVDGGLDGLQKRILSIRILTGVALVFLGFYVFAPMPSISMMKYGSYLSNPREVTAYLNYAVAEDELVLPISLDSSPWNEELSETALFYKSPLLKRENTFESHLLTTINQNQRLPFRVFVVIQGGYDALKFPPTLWRDLDLDSTVLPSGHLIIIFDNLNRELGKKLNLFLTRLEAQYGLSLEYLINALNQIPNK